MTQTLSNELLDGQRKLLAIAVSGANSKAPSLLSQLSNGPLGSLHEKVCCFYFFGYFSLLAVLSIKFNFFLSIAISSDKRLFCFSLSFPLTRPKSYLD